MLKKVKLAVLSAADSVGLSRLVLKTEWRKQKLLILCYHGISLEDEHQWNSSLYMSPDLLRQRFQHLQNAGCNVLPLGQAVAALYAGELPPRAVAITFDDGFYDFYKRAWPLAQEFGFPLTVYLTTYYSSFNKPVFDPALNYLLWKGRGRTLRLSEAMDGAVALNDENFRTTGAHLYKHVTNLGYDGHQKNEFLSRLARALNIDFEALCAKRLLHLMTPAEVTKVSAEGGDVQLHTHRHRVSNQKQQFQREIIENGNCIESATGKQATHFCFPSGFFLPEYAEWLRELKVESATTCVPGIATVSTEPLLLPRLVDTSSVTAVEFGGWVSGLASLLPQRKFQVDYGSYVEPVPETLAARAPM